MNCFRVPVYFDVWADDEFQAQEAVEIAVDTITFKDEKGKAPYTKDITVGLVDEIEVVE